MAPPAGSFRGFPFLSIAGTPQKPTAHRLSDRRNGKVVTLLLILSVGGFTEYKVIHVSDLETCDRWGKLSVEAGETSTYHCLT